MAQHGLTVADVSAPTSAAHKVAPYNAGKKVAPKYRDPATGALWTGRGLKPRWLAEAVANGKTPSDFAI